MSLPYSLTALRLEGSTSQINYAGSIREPLLRNLTNLIGRYFPDENDRDSMAGHAFVLLNRYPKAKWWIEYQKNEDNEPLVQLFWKELGAFLKLRHKQNEIAYGNAGAPTLTIFSIDNNITNTPNDTSPREILPGRFEAIAQLLLFSKKHVALAVNREDVAWGIKTEFEVQEELGAIARDITPDGCTIPNLYISYGCPKPDSVPPGRAFDEQYSTPEMLARRKPGPKMFQQAMRDYGATPETTDVVGVTWDDWYAARNAGVRCYMDAYMYYGEVVLADPPKSAGKVFRW